MKRQLIVMAAVLMCCTSCLRLNLGDLKKFEPSNNIVKNEYKMEAFSKADIDGPAPTTTLPLYENDVVVGSDYNDSVPHVFNNFTRKGVITGSDSQSTPAQVFTSTAHSAE